MVNPVALCGVCDGRGGRFDPGRVLWGGLHQCRGHRDLLVCGADAGRLRSFANPRTTHRDGGTALAIADTYERPHECYAGPADRTPRHRCSAERRRRTALAPAHHRRRQERAALARILIRRARRFATATSTALAITRRVSRAAPHHIYLCVLDITYLTRAFDI